MASHESRFEDNVLPDLKKLADADPELLSCVVTALIDAPPCLTRIRLAKAVSSSVNRDMAEVRPLIQALWVLASTERNRKENADTFVEATTAMLDDLPIQQWPEEYREKWRVVVPEVTRALAHDTAVYLSAKAQELLTEQPLFLCTAQIITDMRPIFDDGADALEGMLPFHTLVLHCHESESEGHRNIHVAVDAHDLRDLRDQIDRAERKERLMRDTLCSAGYTIVGFEPAQDQTEG